MEAALRCLNCNNENARLISKCADCGAKLYCSNNCKRAYDAVHKASGMCTRKRRRAPAAANIELHERDNENDEDRDIEPPVREQVVICLNCPRVAAVDCSDCGKLVFCSPFCRRQKRDEHKRQCNKIRKKMRLRAAHDRQIERARLPYYKIATLYDADTFDENVFMKKDNLGNIILDENGHKVLMDEHSTFCGSLRFQCVNCNALYFHY